MALSCPSCGSENTQKLSLIYSSGTVANSAVAAGITGQGAGIGVIGGMSQSQLAAKYGPPKKNQSTGSIWALFIGLISSIFVGAMFNSEFAAWATVALTFIIAFAIGKSAYRFNRDELPQLYARWEKKLLCLRCGDVFEQGSASPPTAAQTQTAAAPTETISSTRFNVRLMSGGANPINTIKAISDVTGARLSEVKAMVDGAPSLVRVCHSFDEADSLRRRLSEMGAHVTVQEVRTAP